MKRMLLLLTVGIALTLWPEQAAAQSPQEIAKGASVWANHCTRCHQARSPMERTDRQWLTIIAHMRARANLMRSEAQAVATYLQAINGQEGQPPAQLQPATTSSPTGDKADTPGDTPPRPLTPTANLQF